jgi:TonB-linked SusC/RagA family outer membrane protein
MKRRQLVASMLLAVKCTLIQIFLLLFFFCAGFASPIEAQKLLNKKVNIVVQNAELRSVIETLQKQTGIKFVYSPNSINDTYKVSYTGREKTLGKFFEEFLPVYGIAYKIVGVNKVLFYAIPSARSMTTTSTAAADTALSEAAVPDIVITGSVKGENGILLEGVSVAIKGSSISTITDKNGRYSIKVANNKAVLVFSYIGYNSVERTVGNAKLVDVAMREGASELNEVIVLGYGEVKRRDLTGAVGKVQMEDMSKAPVKSFDDALAGRIAGVQVSANDGQPGSVNNIVIRGAGSITQDNSPLYVVDGFPLEDANNNSINPADIESIEILKDASATAIYGARGANGVILITTKRGKQGPTIISYNNYFGLQQVRKKMEMMSPYEFIRYQFEIDSVVTRTTYFTDGKTLESYRNAPALDLQDQLYRNAFVQSHDLSVRGGNEKTKFAISGNIINQDGIIINSGFKRYQTRVALDHTATKKLKIGTNLNASYSQYYGSLLSQPSPTQTVSTNLLYGVWGYRPVTGDDINLDELLYDPTIDPALTSDYRVNPVISARNELRRNTAYTLVANAYADYTVLPGLTLKITGGITYNQLRNDIYNNSKTQSGNPRNSNGVNGSIFYNPSSTWLNENTLTYRKTFNKVHRLTVLGGFTMQGNTSGRHGFQSVKALNESLGLDGLDESASQAAVSSSSRWGMASFLGRVNYDFKSRYLFTASFRADGSSKFLKGNQWGYFPSAAFAWRISGEEFMKKLSFISDAKLRLSYGRTGNNRVSDFAYLSQLNFPNGANYSMNNSVPFKGTSISNFGNPYLKWETTDQVNIGTDLSLFHERLDITVDVYRKTTRDLLLNAELPYSTGLNKAYKNIGSMQNEGIELTVNTVNVRSKSFSWTSSFNIAFNKSKVVELTENQDALQTAVSFDLAYNSLSPYIAVKGQPVAQMYGAIWDGIYQESDFEKTPAGTYLLKDLITTNGNPRTNIKPGDIKYKDLNGDRVVDEKDFTVIGRGLPVHVGGFSNNFTYKGFDLNVFFQWSYGNNLINANRLIFDGNSKFTRYLNQFANYANRWTPENKSNTTFRTHGEGPRYYSNRVVEDGSFLRLKTVSLGYNFDSKLLGKIGLRTLRLYASAQNLYTWSNYSGSDPEVSARHSTLTPGFDFSAYPIPRTIVFGLNTSF